MAEKRWDELWEKIDPDSITGEGYIAWQWVKNTLLRVKAAGDELKKRCKELEEDYDDALAESKEERH